MQASLQALYGRFDFNKTPLAPIGTKALVFDDPEVRASWAPHGTDGFYVGPAKKTLPQPTFLDTYYTPVPHLQHVQTVPISLP